jgi:hypothetical protein
VLGYQGVEEQGVVLAGALDHSRGIGLFEHWPELGSMEFDEVKESALAMQYWMGVTGE